VLYWTRIGELVPTGWWSQRFAVVQSNLRGTIPDGLLVRLPNLPEHLFEPMIGFRQKQPLSGLRNKHDRHQWLTDLVRK